MTLLVGILDSGLDDQLINRAAGSAAFQMDGSYNVKQVPAVSVRTGHGSRLARVVLSSIDEIEFLNAQVFTDLGSSSPVVIATGLDWLMDAGAKIINMSFGLNADRSVLRDACVRALAAGIILVASSPPRGSPVYPAAYEGVISVTGDARCAPGETSFLNTPTVQFGACVHPRGDHPGQPGVSGSSIAAAHLTGSIAKILGSQPEFSPALVIQSVVEQCSYLGVERRTQ
jgi:hypothetical protein